MDDANPPTPEEESQSVETTEEQPSPPWGDDFDAQRAWSTIQNLRGVEKEYKEFQQNLRDPEKGPELLGEYGYELEADDGEDADEWDDDQFGLEDEVPQEDPNAKRLEELEAHIQRLDEQEDIKEFTSHLDDLAKDDEVELSDRDREYLFLASQKLGFNPEATEKAWKEWVDGRKQYEQSVIEKYVGGKKNIPQVSKAGTSANEKPNLDDRNERRRWMTEQYLQGREQS